MKKLNQFLNFKYYQHLIITLVFCIIIIVTLLSSIFFGLFTKHIIQDTKQKSITMLKQVSYSSDIVYQQAMTIGQQLISNNNVQKVMFGSTYEPLIEHNAIYYLNNCKSVYPFVRSIGIYNKKLNRYIATNRIPNNTDDVDKLKYFEDYGTYRFIPRTVKINNHYENYLTYIFYPVNHKTNSKITTDRSFISVNIEEHYIQNLIRSIKQNEQSNTFVINNDGIVLSHLNSDYFRANFSDKEYIKQILESSKKSGTITSNINNIKNLIIYVKSDTINFTFVSIIPLNSLLKQFYKIRNLAFILTILITFIGVLTSIYLGKKFYRPLNKLLMKIDHNKLNNINLTSKTDEFEYLYLTFTNCTTKINQLEHSMHETYNIFNKTILVNLIKGNESNIDKNKGLIKSILNSFSNKNLSLVLLKIGNYDLLVNTHTSEEIVKIKYSLLKISSKVLVQFNPTSLITADDELCVLLSLDDNSINEKNIQIELDNLKAYIDNMINISVTVYYSNETQNINNIKTLYKNLRNNINEKFFIGNQKIINIDTIKDRTSNYDYPYDTEKKLINFIQIHNSNNAIKAIDKLHKYLDMLSYENVIKCMDHLTSKILNDCHNCIKCNELSLYCEDLQKYDSLQAMITDFKEHIERICNANKKTVCNCDSKYKVIDDVIDYVNKNYTDYNLSLEFIADKVNLTPGYLGKLFKEVTKTTFTSYLNSLRIEYAKILLKNSSLTTNEISIKVGIENSNYFYTLFKKNSGMTPTQFRNKSIQL